MTITVINSAGTNVEDSNIRSLSIFSTNVLSYQTFVTGKYSKSVINSILGIQKLRGLKYFKLYCDTTYRFHIYYTVSAVRVSL